MSDVSLPEAAAAIATSEIWKPPINSNGWAGADRIRGSKVTLVCGSGLCRGNFRGAGRDGSHAGKCRSLLDRPVAGKPRSH